VGQSRMLVGLRGGAPFLDKLTGYDGWEFEATAAYSRSVGTSHREGILEERLLLSVETTTDVDPGPGVNLMCGTDLDGDGLPGRDTDADGIGNDCDADFDQSCSVNFVDLGLMKAAFFQPGTTNTDMNGDGQTNFIDLGLLKLGFFRPPGPSGIPNLCSAP